MVFFSIECLLRACGAGLERNLTRKAKRKTPIKVMTSVFGDGSNRIEMIALECKSDQQVGGLRFYLPSYIIIIIT